MPEYTNKTRRMVCRGVNLAAPADNMQEGDFLKLTNTRQREQGSLTVRPGQEKVHPNSIADFNIHSIIELNGTVSTGGAVATFLGANSNLYRQTTSADPVICDSGYSGDPLSMVVIRPEGDVEPWLYIGDRQKNGKVDINGNPFPIGVEPPNTPPIANICRADNKGVANFISAFGWGTNGVSSAMTSINRVSASIAIVLYDTPDNILDDKFYATIVPSFDNGWLKDGVRVSISNGSVSDFSVVVEDVRAGMNPTIIKSIMYDAGSVGLCSLTLETPLDTKIIKRHSLLTINGENVLVLDVVPDKSGNGLPSIRCKTTVTHAVGDSVFANICFRGRVPFGFGVYTFGATIVSEAIQWTSGLGVGSASNGAGADLTTVNFRPLTPDDYMHISLNLSVPSAVTSMRFALDVDSTLTNFTRNYYEYVIPPSVINAAGKLDWIEIVIKLSDMDRIGTDNTRTLKNISNVMIETTTTASINMQANSWYVSGSYGPDAGKAPTDTEGIIYRYRYRSASTNARSVPGPATRSFLYPKRQAISVIVDGTSYPGIDKIDIERLDPKLQSTLAPPLWAYIATITNPGAGNTGYFFDDQDSGSISINPPLETNVFRPFVTPISRIVFNANISGSSLRAAAGTPLPSGLIAGTVVTINGKQYQSYGNPVLGTFLQLTESAGSTVFPISVQIESPVVAGQPMPYLFGPLSGPTANFMFGLGDPQNPGTLYWCNGNDPDSMAATNSIEVTSPSEALISGIVHNQYVYTGSRRVPFFIQPAFNTANLFVPYEQTGSVGFWSRWGVCSMPDGVKYVGHDGLYSISPQQTAVPISDDISSLFPREGKFGEAKYGYNPVNMSAETDIRLCPVESALYFSYKDVEGNKVTAIRSRSIGTNAYGWSFDLYLAPANLHYQALSPPGSDSRLLMGTVSGLLMYANGASAKDSGFDVTYNIITPFDSMTGENRTDKLVGNQTYEIDNKSNPGGCTIRLRKDCDLSDIINTSIGVGPSGLGRTQYILDTNTGNGTLARSVSTQFTGIAYPGQTFYEWNISYVPKPPKTQLQATDYTDDGWTGAKYVVGCVIEANTQDRDGVAQLRTVDVYSDGEVLQVPTLSVGHPGQSEKAYALTPFVAHEMKLKPTDPGVWELFSVRWVWFKYPENSIMLQEDYSDLGEPDAKHIRGLRLTANTADAIVPIAISIDGGSVGGLTFNARHNGRTVIEYAFNPPFVANNMRLEPLANMEIHDRMWIKDDYPLLNTAYTQWSDGGSPNLKYVRGVRPKVDTKGFPVGVTIQIDGGTSVGTITVQANGQRILPAIGFPIPFKAYLLRLVPNFPWRPFGFEWIYDEYPDLSTVMGPWEDGGYIGAKFLQGMIVTGDSDNTPVSFRVETDAGLADITPDANYDGKTGVPYSWPPVICHQMRLVPLNPISTFTVTWVFEPHPELALQWETQTTSHGFDSFSYMRDAVVHHVSTGPLTYYVTGDGIIETYNIPASAGVYKKDYLVLSPRKARLWSHRIVSTNPCRVFKKATSVRMKAWGQGKFQEVHPFGGNSELDGAKI